MTTKTDTEQERALLPCPFCGGEARFDSDDDGWNWIECGGCQVATNHRTSAMDDCRPLLAESWNRRAALQSQDREDAEVTAYALPSGISVERSMQRDGSYLWAVRDGFKKCLSKNGEWDYEPFPSSRTDEWLAAHRFTSASEAIDHARRVEGG